MGLIQITIQRNTTKGEAEMAKTYNTAFEGDLNELRRLQSDVDAAIDKILWDKKDIKPIEKKQAV